MAAGSATLRRLRPERYDELEATGAALEAGLRAAATAAGATTSIARVGALLTVFFRADGPSDIRRGRRVRSRGVRPVLRRDARRGRPPAAVPVRGLVHLARPRPEVVAETIEAARTAFQS